MCSSWFDQRPAMCGWLGEGQGPLGQGGGVCPARRVQRDLRSSGRARGGGGGWADGMGDHNSGNPVKSSQQLRTTNDSLCGGNQKAGDGVQQLG